MIISLPPMQYSPPITTILLTLTNFLIWGYLKRAFFTFAGIAVGVGLLVGVAFGVGLLVGVAFGVGLLVGVAFGVGFTVELAVTISDDFSMAIGEAAWLELPNAIARKAESDRSVPNAVFSFESKVAPFYSKNIETWCLSETIARTQRISEVKRYLQIG